jgi:hypothetical protein
MPKRNEETESTDFNLTIVMGEITSEAVSRELANGSVVTTFDVSTNTEGGRYTVPVSIEGDAIDAQVGQRVLVSGVTRRRFFRSGSGIASRTELLGDRVIPMRRKTQVERVILQAITNLKESARA